MKQKKFKIYCRDYFIKQANPMLFRSEKCKAKAKSKKQKAKSEKRIVLKVELNPGPLKCKEQNADALTIKQ